MKYKITDKRLENLTEPDFMIPSSLGANSVDLRACINGPLTIYPQDQVMVDTGIQVALPKNTIGMILPRSGLGCKGLVLGNLVGNIDPDYRGQVKVCLWNRSEVPMDIKPLDRIAQLAVMPVLNPNNWLMVEELDTTERGSNGFGSTGIT